MKFQSLYTAAEFSEQLPEQILAYNTTRELTHLRLRHIPKADGSIHIREGRRNKLLGAVEFKGRVVEEKGKTYLIGDVARSPVAKGSDIAKFVLVSVGLFLLWTVLPYLICIGFAHLFEADNRIVSFIVPCFTAFCMIFGFVRDWFYTKRRITRFLVSYMQCVAVEDTPLAVRKKPRQVMSLACRIRHLAVWRFFLFPVQIFCRLMFNFRPTKRTVHPKRNFVLMANHVTDFDMLFAGLSIRKQMYFVMSEHMLRKGFASKLLSFGFGPIGRSKGGSAGSTVMNMLRYAREGYNVAIFPEGFRTVTGRNIPFSPATGSLVKKMKIDLITYRIRGSYYTQPCWSPHRRKGKIWGEFAGHYTADQLAKMTDAEVNDLIYRDIYEDADLTQAKYRIPYRSKKGLAEHIEYALWVCPLCHRIGKIHSEGDEFSCECGAKGRFTLYAELESEDFPYRTVGEWTRFQEDFIAKLENENENEVLYEADGQDLVEIDEVHHEDKCLVKDGHFLQTPTYFAVNNRVFYYRDLAFFDIVRRGQLVFTTHSGEYFHVKGEVQLYGVLVKMLYQHFSQK